MKIKLIILLYFLSTFSFAQEIVTTGLFTPNSLVRVEDDLYIFETAGNQISKYDLNNIGLSSEAQTFKSDLTNPKAGVFKDSILYFAQLDRISKIDLKIDPPVVEDVLLNVNGSFALAIDSTSIYFSENLSIYKFDINDPNQIISQVTSTEDSLFIIKDLIIHDSFLYIAVIEDNKLYRLNINDPNKELEILDTNLPNIQKLDIYDDFLYSANSGGSGFVLKWDLNLQPFDRIIVAENLTNAFALLAEDDGLYVVKVNTFTEPDTIVRIANCLTSTLQEINQSTLFNIYPNPSYSSLNIEGSENINSIELFSPDGKLVLNRIHSLSSNRVEIPINDLPSGLYFVRINQTIVRKIVKR